MQYGYFCDNGYKITERNTPRHWYNYLFNNEYITCVSQVGFGKGIAQNHNGKQISIVEDRAIYIFDGERAWLATGLPVQRNLQHYHCFHGLGYTDIEINHRAVRTNCRFFVACEGKREFLRITVKNEAKQTKTLKVIPYYLSGLNTNRVKLHEDKNAIIAEGGLLQQYSYLISTDTVTGYDARYDSFVGPYGDKLHPRAIAEQLGCTNSECICEKSCLVLENSITLTPGESKSFYYTIGAENSLDAIPQYTGIEIEALFNEMQDKYQNICNNLRIHTPWDDLDALGNDWLKYQTCLGAHWGRIHNNSFRDIANDAECLSCFNPELAAEELCRVLSYQDDTGYAPHSFMNGKPEDLHNSGNALWAVFAAYAITKELGDVDFLMRKVPFSNGDCATIYEHIKRVISYLWKFTGHMGLIKICSGDVTEEMDQAGVKEKGVSVWLSIAFVRAAQMLSQMANWMGSAADSKTAAYYAQEMEKRVCQYAWDEDRYLYAISDDKSPIGAKQNAEGSLYALPQIWSILAEFDREKSKIAMGSLETELNTDLGIQFNTPPYTEYLSHVGSLTRLLPGMPKNGGIDLQTSAWKLIADCMLQRNDKIEENLRKILPQYNCESEPYVLSGGYLGEQAGYRAGQPTESWSNATGQTLLYTLIRYIFGLQPEFGGMLIKPCLPISWKDCSVSKVFRGCRYNIHYVQKDKGACNTIDGIYVNGNQVNANLPIRPQVGKTLNIEVILRT